MADDDLEPAPEYVPPEPRFRIEAETWEELVEQLKALAPEPDALRFLGHREERPRSPEEAEPPPRMSHQDLRDLADELQTRLARTLPFDGDEDAARPLGQSDWKPSLRSERGAVLRRYQARRARQLQAEPGYLWLFDAMNAREPMDRNRAVEELERIADAARLERLAEHSTHRNTRRAALDALFRLNALSGLESAALYVRAVVFTPKKPKSPVDEEAPTPARGAAPEFYDDTRDHAVDLIAQLADASSEDALDALLRIVRYDFSTEGGARLRALRRLGERVERLESRADWEGLALLYRESKNTAVHRRVADTLAAHLEEIVAVGAADALLPIADLRQDLQDTAERALRQIESPPKGEEPPHPSEEPPPTGEPGENDE